MATKSDIKKQWYTATVAETCEAFGVQIKKGLTTEQIKVGSREIKKSSLAARVVAPKISIAFWATVSIMLVLAASVYALESNTAVFVFAFSACLLGAFALIQQGFVKHILQVASKVPPLQIRVRRNGQLQQVAANNIVMGDIIILKPGDFVPADLRLVEVKELFIDETESTGQGSLVAKNTFTLNKKVKERDQKNMVFVGSYVISGTGTGIVVMPPANQAEPIELNPQKLNKKQQKRNTFIMVAVFLLGLSVVAWKVPLVAALGLSALLAMSTHYYALFWLQFVTWASLYDQATITGLKFKSFKALKSFSKVDTVFVNVPSDFADIAALIHQLQAELRIEVRPLIKASDVSKLEKELNISGSALTYKEFMGANRAKKIQQLNEYQLLVGFDSVATAEAVSLMQQSSHHVAWIDDSDIPQPASVIADTYISLADEPTAMIQAKSDIASGKQVSLKKIAAFFDAKVKFKSITAY